jgi:hypothetical protein
MIYGSMVPSSEFTIDLHSPWWHVDGRARLLWSWAVLLKVTYPVSTKTGLFSPLVQGPLTPKWTLKFSSISGQSCHRAISGSVYCWLYMHIPMHQYQLFSFIIYLSISSHLISSHLSIYLFFDKYSYNLYSNQSPVVDSDSAWSPMARPFFGIVPQVPGQKRWLQWSSQPPEDVKLTLCYGNWSLIVCKSVWK